MEPTGANEKGKATNDLEEKLWWEQMDTLGVLSPRWLETEMVRRYLFMAYTLLGVKVNDEEMKLVLDYALKFF